MMPTLSVIADTPENFTLSGDVATSQVQIAKTGAFKDPRYGNFAITLADFKRWVANFESISKADGRLGLPVDIDHGPETKGNTEAAGWMTQLSIKGNELWATVEWNSLGKELVADRRYAYLSPSYVHDFKDEQGKSHGTALLGVALTNRPFLTMATVSLSKHTPFAAEEMTYTPESMELAQITQALGLAADADEATVLSKISELAKPAVKPATVSLADQAKAEGMTLLNGDQFASLMQNATEGAAAAKQLSQLTFDTAFDAGVKEGQLLPAQRETLLGLYDKDRDSTLSLMKSMPKVVNVTATGANGGSDDASTQLSGDLRDDDGYAVDEDRVRLHNKAVELSTAQKIEYGDALMLAAEQLGL